MKIFIAGDSFAADWSIKYPTMQGWPNMLADIHTVTNAAEAGCGEYKILKQLTSHALADYDAIIVSHTSPYRIHTNFHPVHGKDKLHYNSDFIYEDCRAHKLKFMIEYFEKMVGLKAMHTPDFNAFLHEVMSEPRANSNGLTEREVLLQTALAESTGLLTIPSINLMGVPSGKFFKLPLICNF
jgi:hypothetical protein